MIRKLDAYRNYSATELDEMQQADAERDVLTNDFDAERAERAKIIVSGLISKYGFSEAGAQQVIGLIRQVNLHGETGVVDARFATEEKHQAALRASEYYWK